MINKFLLFVLILFDSTMIYAQSMSTGNHGQVIYFQNRKMIEEFKKLQFDSIKIYYFNKSKYNVNESSLKVNTSQVYNSIVYPDTAFTAINGSSTQDKGSLLSPKESKQLISLLTRKVLIEKYVYEPIQAYIPTIGIVFFLKKMPAAHIDIAFNEQKMRIEINHGTKSVSKYSRDYLGHELENFIRCIVKNYNFPDWVLKRSPTIWSKD